MQSIQRITLCLAVLVAFGSPTEVVNAGVITLSNGSLTVTVGANGAITSAMLANGAMSPTEFFNPAGTPSAFHTADFGISLTAGTGASRFGVTQAQGVNALGVSQSSTYAYSGSTSAAEAELDFTRSYSLVDGLNVLRITTTFMQTMGSSEFTYFETLDPNQGGPISGPATPGVPNELDTRNSTINVQGVSVARARIDAGQTLVLGSVNSASNVGSGGSFPIDSTLFGSLSLQALINGTSIGNDTPGPNYLDIGYTSALTQGQSTTFVYDLAFGNTPDDAEKDFRDANPRTVPEPTSMVVFGFGIIGLGLGSFRRRRRQ